MNKEKQTIKRRQYLVETGDFRKQVNAENIEHAIISAFAVNPPRNPGVLVRIRLKKPNRKEREGVWNYLDIERALEVAGYNVLKP